MPTSKQFLTVCKKCKTLCCTLVLPPVTEKERNAILKAGFTDYFTHISNEIYTIKPTDQGKCPYLSCNDSCTIHQVKPKLCRVWPVIPYYKNNKRGYIVIKCPLFSQLSKEDIICAKKEAETISIPIIEKLWNISPETKQKCKVYDYEEL